MLKRPVNEAAIIRQSPTFKLCVAGGGRAQILKNKHFLGLLAKVPKILFAFCLGKGAQIHRLNPIGSKKQKLHT